MDKTITNKYIRIAKDLMYPDDVVKKIRSAKSEYEISQILRYARHQDWGQENKKEYKYTQEEKMYIYSHCFEDYRTVAAKLGRKPETVKKYMTKYRKEKNNDRNRKCRNIGLGSRY